MAPSSVVWPVGGLSRLEQRSALICRDRRSRGRQARSVEPLDDGPYRREPRLRFDTRARLLETVMLVLDGGEEMVIHAMRERDAAAPPTASTAAGRLARLCAGRAGTWVHTAAPRPGSRAS